MWKNVARKLVLFSFFFLVLFCRNRRFLFSSSRNIFLLKLSALVLEYFARTYLADFFAFMLFVALTNGQTLLTERLAIEYFRYRYHVSIERKNHFRRLIPIQCYQMMANMAPGLYFIERCVLLNPKNIVRVYQDAELCSLVSWKLKRWSI